jgi:putative toxin-antitoxin system antitoxin component (TIGR02293 family)
MWRSGDVPKTDAREDPEVQAAGNGEGRFGICRNICGICRTVLYCGDRRVLMARAARKSKICGLAEDARPFLHEEIVEGVKARRVQGLIDRGVLDKKQVFRVIPERTFNRRLATGDTLKPTEGDAIARLLRVTEAANKAFGDADFARRYLALPNPALGNRIPFELAETDAGAREVEAALIRFAHGIYI